MNRLKELHRTLREKGLIASLDRVIGHAKRKVLTYGDVIFDIRHGVNTCGQKSIVDLDIDESIKSNLISYEPSPVKVIRSTLNALDVDHKSFTFIDFGSGKGRVLLLASEYPYQKVTGVELSNELHEIAQNNIRRWASPARKCADLQSIHMNALDFKLPDEPLVLFFFTPFFGEVFGAVVNKIQAMLQNSKHTVHVVYYGRNQENIDRLRRLGIAHKDIVLKNVFSSTGKFGAHLFSRTA